MKLLIVALMGLLTLVSSEVPASYPYFRCSDGTRMYVDHPSQTWWVNYGPRHKSAETDKAYELAYNVCNPNIKP